VNKCGGFFCVGKYSHFYLDELLYLYVKLGKNGKQIKCMKHTLICRDFEAEGWLGTVRPVGKYQSYGADFPKPVNHEDFRKMSCILVTSIQSYVCNKMDINL